MGNNKTGIHSESSQILLEKFLNRSAKQETRADICN